MIRPFAKMFRRHHREVVLLAGMGVALLCLWSFIAIAGETKEPEHRPLEEKILRAFRQVEDSRKLRGPTWMEEVVRDASALGGMTVTVLLVTLIGGYRVITGQFRSALFLVVAVAGSAVLSWALKHLYDRPRPTAVPLLMQITDSSFPSGHSLNSAAVFITLGMVMAMAAEQWTVRLYFLAAGFFVCFVVGLSRVMLGVHYPTDVLGGWVAGTGWALLCCIVFALTETAKPTKSDRR